MENNLKITLKAARVNNNLTLKQASEKLGITPQTLSKWENGKAFPRVNKLKEIEKLYNKKYDEIIFFKQKHGKTVKGTKK